MARLSMMVALATLVTGVALCPMSVRCRSQTAPDETTALKGGARMAALVFGFLRNNSQGMAHFALPK